MGIDSKNLRSTDDVLNAMNYRKAMMDQHLKQEFKGLGLGKGIKSLEKATKKDPFQGWTPKVVEGGGTSADDFLKLKQDTFRRLMTNTDDDVQAFTKRVINNQQDVKFEKLSKDQRKDMLNMIQDRIQLGNRKFMDEYKDLDVGFDPEDFASGGIARVGMFKGGKVWKKFIEGLFIKSSNDIRLGKGKWAGLTQEQWIKQHDDLTKMLKKWEWGGKKGLPQGAEQFIGMNDLQVTKAIKEAEAKATRLGKRGPHWKEREVKEQMSEFEFEAKKAAEGKPVIPLGGMDERTALKQKYPGISDDLLEKILVDDNPQRKADVIGTIDDYMKLREIGKSEAEAYDIITKSFSKNPTKHASGGIAGQLHLNEGGRVPMIFGGSAGLKAMIKNIIEGINKGRKNKIKTLFPKYSADEKELLKLGEKYLPRDAATLAAQEAAGKAEGVQVLINRLKNDKKILEQMAKNKAMKDPGLDFMMKHLEETMYPPNLKKYKNIDKDILQLETIKKNLVMKDRKLNAEGGIAGELHLNDGGRVSFTKGGKVSSGLAHVLGV